MKKTTLQKRITKLNLSKNSFVYKTLMSVADGQKMIRTCYASGSGRFTSNHDHTLELRNYLDNINVKYVFGNDAPRNSACYNFLSIKTKVTE